MFYFIYQITNLSNGMKYIGVHQTENLEDGYMGSGLHILRAIKKYGKECFKKDILEFFESSEEAYAAEKKLVTEKIVNDNSYYNLRVGGRGGSNKGHNKGKPKTEEHKQKIKDALTGLEKSEEHKIKISESKKKYTCTMEHKIAISEGQKRGGITGKYERSEQTKELQRQNRRQQRWINNGYERKMVNVTEIDDYLNNGWKLGKKI